MASFTDILIKWKDSVGRKCGIEMMSYYKEKLKIGWNYLKSEYLTIKNKKDHGLNSLDKYAFIFFAADYNNLGDLAITISQQKFLTDLIGNEYIIIMVNESDTYSWVYEIKKLPPQNVLITLIGGGNSGSLYDFIEVPRRFLLKYFKDYRIISFPQTVYFDNSKRAIAIRMAFTDVANKCRDLTLVAREKNSEQLYLDITNASVLLTPDIVFSYEKYVGLACGDRKLDAVALILRQDKEKSLGLSFQNELISFIEDYFDDVEYMDTCDIKYEEGNAQELLDNYLARLQTKGLVITDRLHGMILSYITKTPCIVFNNNNCKIKSTYETWLQGQNIVRLFDFENGTMSELKKLIDEMINQRKYVDVDLEVKFDALREVLRRKM